MTFFSLAIPSSARMKTSPAPHTTKSRFFNLCKPPRQEPDCLQVSLGLTHRSIVAPASNSLLPESKAASHTANLMSDAKRNVNNITSLIAQSKLIRYLEISLVFPKPLVRTDLKESGSLLMRAITIFCFYVLLYHLLTQKLTVSA